MKTSESFPLYEVGVNCRIASKIIELHDAGIIFDFEMLAGYQVFCAQEKCFVSLKDISTGVIDQCFAQVNHCSG